MLVFCQLQYPSFLRVSFSKRTEFVKWIKQISKLLFTNGFSSSTQMANHFVLTHDSISVEPILQKVKSPECGAVSIFVGTARNNFNGHEVVSLHYEAFEKMAHRKFVEVCDEIRLQWRSIVQIALHHRLGEVAVTENIVVAAISSPHRVESLAALSFLLDKLKERVPIWKKEIYRDSPSVWKENVECTNLLMKND